MSEDLVAWARETFPAPIDFGPVTTHMRKQIRAMADRLEALEAENRRFVERLVFAEERAARFAGKALASPPVVAEVFGLHQGDGTRYRLNILRSQVGRAGIVVEVAYP